MYAYTTSVYDEITRRGSGLSDTGASASLAFNIIIVMINIINI